MNDVAVVVFSCDKNEELWPIFYQCLEKYWPNHPHTYLLTETINSPIMETITLNYDLDHWTNRMRESLKMIPNNKIVFICDDCFLKEPINMDKFSRCFEILSKDNTASINFELLDDYRDKECPYEGFRLKSKESSYVVSFLCGLWNKDKLIDILSVKDCSPWKLEMEQIHKDFDYYQNVNEKILSWFRDGGGENAAIRQGKWMHGIEDFLKSENLEVDFSKKGFWSENFWKEYREIYGHIDEMNKIIEESQIKLEQYQKELRELVDKECNG